MTDFYRISEFAHLAGVTVRTLQYYDRINLLKPSQTTNAGHRLYQRADLLRLQQILTLKWMGFQLDQIKELLDSPTYDLHTALHMQKSAIDSQIARLQEASDALSTALELDGLQSGTLNHQAINKVIRAVMSPTQDWWQGKFTDEAWAGIVTRRMQYTSADFEQFAEDWRVLIEQFAELSHLPADSTPVQQLAETMHQYVMQFSAGDTETEAGVRQVWQNRDEMPQSFQQSTPNPDLTRFMQQALVIYREKRDI